MTTMRAFSTEGNNMECYAEPDSVGELVSTKWNMFLILMYYYIYSTRNHQLTDFLQKELAERQQECLQNVFDN